MGIAGQDARRRTARTVAQKLESLAAAGITHLPKPGSGKDHEAAAATIQPAASPSQSPTVASAGPARSASDCDTPACHRSSAEGATLFDAPRADRPTTISLVDRAAALEVLRTEVVGCTRCRELAATRTQTVFGVGNPQARLCFLGEAPGADEDARGEPFVGRAGQLLNKIIEACTLKREDVYILNVLKCRPPGNRTPAPDEVTNCRGYLNRQLELIRPEYICCLGAVAARTLLNTESSMAKLRGRFYLYEGIEVLCTYHPAYLLRNPAAKKDVWEDMKLLLGRMGITL